MIEPESQVKAERDHYRRIVDGVRATCVQIMDEVEELRNERADEVREKRPAAPTVWSEQQRADDAEGERDRLRAALEWIADHSQEHTLDVHGYRSHGAALSAVHDRARRETDPNERSTES
jgi:hypothetical protein